MDARGPRASCAINEFPVPEQELGMMLEGLEIMCAASLMLEGLEHHVRVGGIAPLTHTPCDPSKVSKVVRTSKVCMYVCE